MSYFSDASVVHKIERMTRIMEEQHLHNQFMFYMAGLRDNLETPTTFKFTIDDTISVHHFVEPKQEPVVLVKGVE